MHWYITILFFGHTRVHKFKIQWHKNNPESEQSKLNYYIYVGFECLFSKNIQLTKDEELSFKQLIEFYSPDVECFDKSLIEMKLWNRKINKYNTVPKSGLEALAVCDKNIYPNIFLLLKILCTLPVSTTTPERMFSTLKRVKTYLRSTMGEVIKNEYITVVNFVIYIKLIVIC